MNCELQTQKCNRTIKYKFWNAKCEIQNAKYIIRVSNPKYEMWNAKSKMQPNYKIQTLNAKCKIQNAKYIIRIWKPKYKNVKYEFRNATEIQNRNSEI